MPKNGNQGAGNKLGPYFGVWRRIEKRPGNLSQKAVSRDKKIKLHPRTAKHRLAGNKLAESHAPNNWLKAALGFGKRLFAGTKRRGTSQPGHSRGRFKPPIFYLRKGIQNMERISRWLVEKFQCYTAVLYATAPLLPTVAMLFLAVLYLKANGQANQYWHGLSMPVCDLICAILIWGVSPFVLFRLAQFDGAIPSSYGQFDTRWERLKTDLRTSKPPKPESSPNAMKYFELAQDQNRAIHKFLEKKGLPWVSGSGYVHIWEMLHCAEQYMIEILPLEMVLDKALYDELRLMDSDIPQKDDLLAKLRKAVESIGPSAARFLANPPATNTALTICTLPELPEGTAGRDYKVRLLAAGGLPPYDWAPVGDLPNNLGLRLGKDGVLSGIPKKAKPDGYYFKARVNDAAKHSVESEFSIKINKTGTAVADLPYRMERGVLRVVRQGINEYRDTCWKGLIELRNRIFNTMFTLSLLAFVLLLISIVRGATIDTVEAASVFFLVGAVIGLATLLNDAMKKESAADDEGLSNARLVATPVFSGVAAVFGVALTVLTMNTSTGKGPDFSTIFILGSHLNYLLVAAAFGLTPGVLFSSLQQQSEKIQANLKSSKATEKAKTP
jgi:hypothetical protein